MSMLMVKFNGHVIAFCPRRVHLTDDFDAEIEGERTVPSSSRCASTRWKSCEI